jgi:hypothetical protein
MKSLKSLIYWIQGFKRIYVLQNSRYTTRINKVKKSILLENGDAVSYAL